MKSWQTEWARRGRSAVLLFLFVVALPGCALFRDTYHDQSMDFGSIAAVAVLPFENLSRDRSAGVRVRDVFVTKLLATHGVYVLPAGEVSRGVARAGVLNATTPSPEDAVKLGREIEADAVIIGTLREYGDVRSGTTSANIISLSLRMMEAETGRLVWSASSTKGGISVLDRLVGGGGKPMNKVTEKAVNDLIGQLFQ